MASSLFTAVVVAAPKVPHGVTIAVNVPQQVSFCSGVTIDAVGSSGNVFRPYVVRWALVGDPLAGNSTGATALNASTSAAQPAGGAVALVCVSGMKGV